MVLKRFFDIVFSFIGLILLSPFFLIFIILIKVESKGPAFFLQERLGKNRTVFKIVKFRTMFLNSEKSGSGLFTNHNDPRITNVGHFLRKFSLDELPQFFNILKGDMSFVGPRPPVPYHPYKRDDYPEKYIIRFKYRPGITGWAQVHGRTNLSWPQRLELDAEYHKRYTFWLDIRIIFITLRKILYKEDIYPEDISIGKSHLYIKKE